jgi:hypothetical protein
VGIVSIVCSTTLATVVQIATPAHGRGGGARGGGIAPTRRSSRRSMIRRARGRAPSFLGMISTAAAAHGLWSIDRRQMKWNEKNEK